MSTDQNINQTLMSGHPIHEVVLLVALCVIAINQLSAQMATTLLVNDTRSGDSMPSAYKHVARFDFKYRSVIHAPGSGVYNGLLTLAPWSDASGGAAYQLTFNPNGPFFRTGNYTTNTWSGWSKLVLESSPGITTIGNGASGSGLNVNGTVKAKEVNVTLTGWADDVFEQGYPLPTLRELEREIRDKGHLPDMPSTKEVLQKGVDLGEMNRKLLRKIEELTLYIIDQEKRINALESKITAPKNERSLCQPKN